MKENSFLSLSLNNKTFYIQYNMNRLKNMKYILFRIKYSDNCGTKGQAKLKL